MSKSLQDILNETQNFVAAKQASFSKEAAEQALTSPSSIPGSQNDVPAPSGAEASDSEVKQELPPNPQSNSGAGSPEKTETGHATDATQPIAGVKKEPLESAEEIDKGVGASSVGDQPDGGSAGGTIGGSSRSVAKEANNLLASISRYQAAKGTAKAAAGDYGTPAKKSEPKADATTCDCGKEDCDCAKSKEAAPADMELTQDVLAKIASMMLSTEDGWNVVEQTMSKAAGAEAAKELMTVLEKEAADNQVSDAYQQGAAAADELVKRAAYEQGLDDAFRQMGVDPAQFQAPAAEKAAGADDFATLGRQAADAAIMKAAQELGAEEAGAPMEEAPAEMGGAPEMAGDVPGAEEAAAGMTEAPEEDIAPEELEQAMAMLVAEGQLSEEGAGSIMEYISGAGEVGGAAEGAPEGPDAMMAPEMGAPGGEMGGGEEPAAGPEAMEVQAAAKKLKIRGLADKIANSIKK